MLVKILALVGILILCLVVYAALKEPAMNISRDMVIAATPERLFPYLNNSKKMNDWMPWQDSDPNCKMQYSGPEEGVQSKSFWESTGKMGTGSSTIIESVPNKSVKSQLVYTKPMEMSQFAEISLTPVAGGTQVTWSVDGHNNFLFRLVGIFISVDKMIGGEFEKGLSKLKNQVESTK